MVKLVTAFLAIEVERDERGITSVNGKLAPRDELMLPGPPPLTVRLALAFKFSAPTDTQFAIAYEVRWFGVGTPLSFDSRRMRSASADGEGEYSLAVHIPVAEVGPYVVSLLFDGQEVWKQMVFFARW